MSPAVFYDDAAAAIDWLCRAFGFDVRLKVEGDGGRIEHSELMYGEGLIMVGDAAKIDPLAGRSFRASPRAVNGANTQSIMVFVDDAEGTARGRAPRARPSSPNRPSTTTDRTTGRTAATAPSIQRATAGGSPSAYAPNPRSSDPQILRSSNPQIYEACLAPL